jgi:hypothetical protein
MATRKKGHNVLYRAKYTIDIEITDEPLHSDERDARSCRINLEKAERFSDPNAPDWAKDWDKPRFERFDYVERFFPEAARELYLRMFWLESLALHFGRSAQVRAVFRREMIKHSGKMEQQRIRRHQSTRRGRILAKESAQLWSERERFTKLFFRHLGTSSANKSL